MQLIAIFCGAVLFISAAALAYLSPDILTLAILSMMILVLLPGYFFGIFRLCRYAAGFRTAQNAIRKTVQNHPSQVWLSISEQKSFFKHKGLDKDFRMFIEQSDLQKKKGQIAVDIEEIYNEDLIRLKTRQGLIHQISGTLTGLGLLGTFIGLITGISGIGFSSVDAAIRSIQDLMEGIQTAFFTSIAGVILSILFNLFQNYSWQLMESELGLFLRDFHMFVIPSNEEIERRQKHRELHQILEKLELLTKTSALGGGKSGKSEQDNEHILMPQIMDGLKNSEFTFYVQPIYDLNTRRILSGEALVRWNHSKMGLVSPAVFLPILESNGAIVQLDKYIWEKVVQTVHLWTTQKKKIRPITVNISKTDLLSTDVVEVLSGLLRKYQVSPRYIEIDLAMDAYLQAPEFTREIQEKLQHLGFRTVIDGFDGNCVALSQHIEVTADAVKLNLNQLENENNKSGMDIAGVMAYANTHRITITANGISTMDQLSQLRKNGCFEGQGFYFSKALPLEEFEKKIEESN